MRYIKNFNESLGISKDLERQVDNYLSIIANSKSQKFDLIYECEGMSYPFTLYILNKIGDSEYTFGQFIANMGGTYSEQLIIEMKKSKGAYTDKYTLLHEVKHLDYYIRQKKKFTDFLYRSGELLHNLPKGQYLSLIKEILYAFDKNEFESQYHSYYIEIDEYISNNINKYKSPSSGDISALIYECLVQTDNKLYTWWWNTKKFNFDDYFSEKELNKVLVSLISKDNKKYDLLYYLTNLEGIKRFIKHNLNIYTNEEKLEMRKIRKDLEREINKRRIEFRKKFIRIFTIMSNKYSKA